MHSNDNLSKARRILGLAMILAGVFCFISQFTNGRRTRADFGQSLAYAATVQTNDTMPRVESAQAETRAVAGTLETTLRGILAQAEKPEWVGYSVDDISDDRSMCCGNWNDGAGCGTCRLENDHNWTSGSKNDGKQASGAVKLEGSRRLVVLFRLEAKQVDRIRVASEDCTLDAGGLPFLWLTGVKPSESVALLTTYVQGTVFEHHEHHNTGNGALTAIALHATRLQTGPWNPLLSQTSAMNCVGRPHSGSAPRAEKKGSIPCNAWLRTIPVPMCVPM